ncbi:MAG: membrane protein insertion efficiency factor YidD [Clostridia bacterium]|nr:membrane protein insertion efficiency factor YidD [Clostridia bacterium]
MKRIVIFPIRLYQKYLSPAKPPCCRFTPTCSQYAIDAVLEWGVIIGLLLALWRILRCNPFSKGGEDPVPVNRLKRRFLEKRKLKKALKQQKKHAQTEKAEKPTEEPQTK